MSTITANFDSHAATAQRSNPSYQAYLILHVGFTGRPLLRASTSFFTYFAIGINISRPGSPTFPRSAAIT
jgi:hypothetical protein